MESKLKIKNNIDVSYDSINLELNNSSIYPSPYIDDTSNYENIQSIFDNTCKYTDLIKLEQNINEKINNFLNFLIMKKIIKKGEYEEFLDSLKTIEKLKKE